MLVRANSLQKTFPSDFYFSPQLKTLFNYLLQDGSELRVVGGSVRDFLANRTISDIDLACKYAPEKTISILKHYKIRTIATGIKYGTITAIVNEEKFQITTLRKDTKNFGRDCEVEFVDDFFEDAKRRDFTINAMSIDFSGQIYDYFGGKKDLENKIVKFIGNADVRIKEDYLRILRFFRFSCFYGNNLNQEGLEACYDNKNNIDKLSLERIREEFIKILSCQNRDNLLMIILKMSECGILKLILRNEENIDGLKNVFKLEKILNCQFSVMLLLVALNCSDQTFLSKKEKKYFQTIVKLSKIIDFKASKNDISFLLMDFDKNTINDALIMKLIFVQKLEIFIDDLLRIRTIIASAEIPNFPVSGYDLIAVGIIPENIGAVLKQAKKYWLDANFLLTKQEIIDFIKSIPK